MLKQRVITAVLLLAVLLPALFYPSPEPFCVLALVFIGAAGWEWARLNGSSPASAVGWGASLAVGLAVLWVFVGLETPQPWLWKGVGIGWLLLAAWLLRRGVPGWASLPRSGRLLVGWLLIGAAWWALAQARYAGVEMLLSMLVLVWVADIAAYFGGKAFGRRKLAPTISPGKSWAGVYSGWFGVAAVALVWGWSSTGSVNVYSTLGGMGALAAVVGLTVLVGMSVAGDLVESLVKRSAGMKDSSQLLPGHGGVLDRVDALLPVLPLAMMLVTW